MPWLMLAAEEREEEGSLYRGIYVGAFVLATMSEEVAVSSLFASRKGKKKGKKRFDAIAALAASQKAAETGVEEETGNAGNDKKGFMSNKQFGLDSDKWASDTQDKKRTQFVSNKGVIPLQETEKQETVDYHQKHKVDTIRNQFHSTRLAAKQKDSNPEKEVEEEQPKTVYRYRPRHMVQKGEEALKNLDNEQVFPTLGGKAVAKKITAANAAAGSAWGQVDASALIVNTFGTEDLFDWSEFYLGEDFIAAETFTEEKVGYVFTTREEGVGYFWDNHNKKPLPKIEEQPPVEEAAPEPAEVSTEPEAAAAASAPSEEAAPIVEASEPPAEPENTEDTKAEKTKTETKAAPAEEDMARFEGLKKKKKKKKKAVDT